MAKRRLASQTWEETQTGCYQRRRGSDLVVRTDFGDDPVLLFFFGKYDLNCKSKSTVRPYAECRSSRPDDQRSLGLKEEPEHI